VTSTPPPLTHAPMAHEPSAAYASAPPAPDGAGEPRPPFHLPRGRYPFYGPELEARRRIEAALRFHRGNTARAAAALAMARNTLRLKLRHFALDGHKRAEPAGR